MLKNAEVMNFTSFETAWNGTKLSGVVHNPNRTMLPHVLQGLCQDAGLTDTFKHDIGGPAQRGSRPAHHVLAGLDERRRANGSRQVRLQRREIHDTDLCGSQAPAPERHRQSDRPGAQNEHARSRGQTGERDAVKRDGQWLDQRTVFHGGCRGQFQTLPVGGDREFSIASAL
jgi:hypothetical protein